MSITPVVTGTSPTTPVTPATSPTPIPGNTYISLTVAAEALGASHDGTPRPVHKQRTMKLCVYDLGADPTGDSDCKKGMVKELVFPVSFNYKNEVLETLSFIDLGRSIVTGKYKLLVTVDRYLRTNIGTQTITSGQVNSIDAGRTELAVGDVNGDNAVDVLDWNIVRDCFQGDVEDRSQSPSCGQKKEKADVTDDGRVNGIDINWVLVNMGLVGD